MSWEVFNVMKQEILESGKLESMKDQTPELWDIDATDSTVADEYLWTKMGKMMNSRWEAWRDADFVGKATLSDH